MFKFTLKSATFLAFLSAACCCPVEEPLNASCTISDYANVSSAASRCSALIIKDMTVPAGKALDISLKTGASLTFQGTITFAKSNWNGPLVEIKGNKVTVAGASGAVLDGQGAQYWDGKGDNGVKKPKFFRIKTTGGSNFNNINLLNCPKQCVSINAAKDTTLTGWTIDVSAGDSAGGLNTDGFDISRSQGITIQNAIVKNQDDCVVINQGYNYVFKNLTCSGGHGLSLSVGQSSTNGSPNTVENVTFTDCTVTNSRNGIHIKTHSDAGTGSISDVTFKNIAMSGITRYGINIQEDYLNGVSSGIAKGNIPITGLVMSKITGSMSGNKKSMPVYILCGSEGCANWNWSGVSITNGKIANQCNFTPLGFTC